MDRKSQRYQAEYVAEQKRVACPERYPELYRCVGMEKNTVYRMDAIEFLRHIDDESVDLVLTDPPYNISEGTVPVYDTRYKRRWHRESRKIHLNEEWDKFTDEEFLEMMFSLIDEVYRILKKSGTFICFTSDKYLSFLRSYIIGKGMVYRQTCIWVKSNPVPQMRKVKFMHATELFFTANKEKHHDSFRWENGHRCNVFYHPIVGGKERTPHPTQKPLWLMRELIRYYTRAGDLVVDPFAGSGTTLVASKQLGRNFVGCDISEEYVEIARERLSQKTLTDSFGGV